MINAGSMSGLATEVSRALKKHGYTMGQVRDRNSGEPTATTIEYGAGAETDARNVATLLGLDAPKQPDPTMQPGHIRVTVDTNFSMPAPDDSTMDERDHDHHHDDQQGQHAITTTAPPPPIRRPIKGNRSTAAGCRALTRRLN